MRSSAVLQQQKKGQDRKGMFNVCVFVYPARLLAEKHSELGGKVSKLRNGLFKISDTREKVEAMSVELEEAKKQVAECQISCDEYLSVILQQKKEADKQQKVWTRMKSHASQQRVVSTQMWLLRCVCFLCRRSVPTVKRSQRRNCSVKPWRRTLRETWTKLCQPCRRP